VAVLELLLELGDPMVETLLELPLSVLDVWPVSVVELVPIVLLLSAGEVIVEITVLV
jgi:hypothetical protein